MINTQELEHLIKLAVLSTHIKDERPVSVLICARVESGKTELLKKTIPCKGIAYLGDATAWGIQKEYLDAITKREIRTLVIPDLITPLSRGSDTVETFVAFLNGLIEEGIVEIQTYALQKKLEIPARCNIVTSIAQEHLFDQRHRWSKMGFISRVVPISFEYAASTVYDIGQSIASEIYHEEDDFSDLVIPDDDIAITTPQEIALKIASLAPQVIDKRQLADKLYGFRLQKQLGTLCKTNAMMDNRETVNEEDFNTIKQLSNYMNLTFKQI